MRIYRKIERVKTDMAVLMNIATLDQNLLLWIQEYVRQEWMTPFWTFVTSLGDAGWFWIVVSALLLLPESTRKVGIMALVSLGIGALITNVALKNLVARIRPYEVIEGLQLLIEPQSDFSFPSGHSCASFAAAMVYYRMLPKKYGVPAVVLAVFIACSRLYVGVHYPSDVVVGVCIGVLSAWISYKIVQRIERRDRSRPL